MDNLNRKCFKIFTQVLLHYKLKFNNHIWSMLHQLVSADHYPDPHNPSSSLQASLSS